MLKSFLIIVNLQIFIYASQIILVIADDTSTHKAKLQLFENGKKIANTIDANIGKNGLGLGISDIEFSGIKIDINKREGDKKAPLGIFKLTSVFGYKKEVKTKMPYIYASKELICVDDSNSKYYNKIIQMPLSKPKSFETMRRDDNQYKLGVVVAHNEVQIKNGGSCIFIHVQKGIDAPTAGCTSMKYEDMKFIVEWLDISKNPILIQITKEHIDTIKNRYPNLEL